MAVTAHLVSVLFEGGTTLVVEKVIGIVFQVVLAVLLLRNVYRTPSVTSETICAALSAYIVLGLIWANAYFLLEHHHPGSFSFPMSEEGEPLKYFGGERGHVYSVYFSFVSLTTLGYGDITPLSPAACTTAVCESILGQMFLAVLIARLVGLQIVHVSGKRNGGCPDRCVTWQGLAAAEKAGRRVTDRRRRPRHFWKTRYPRRRLLLPARSLSLPLSRFPASVCWLPCHRRALWRAMTTNEA
jgi:hypothetical protein